MLALEEFDVGYDSAPWLMSMHILPTRADADLQVGKIDQIEAFPDRCGSSSSTHFLIDSYFRISAQGQAAVGVVRGHASQHQGEIHGRDRASQEVGDRVSRVDSGRISTTRRCENRPLAAKIILIQGSSFLQD